MRDLIIHENYWKQKHSRKQNVIETIGENENAIENIMGEKRETWKQLNTSFAVNSAGEHKNFDNNVDYDAELRHQRGREQE